MASIYWHPAGAVSPEDPPYCKQMGQYDTHLVGNTGFFSDSVGFQLYSHAIELLGFRLSLFFFTQALRSVIPHHMFGQR